MPRDVRVFLDDIIAACDKIQRYTSGLSLERFRSDEKTTDAVIRNLEVIGEAAKSLPPEIHEKIPEIEWKRIAALRNILIHEYFGVDLDIVWDLVANKIPPLRRAVAKFLAL